MTLMRTFSFLCLFVLAIALGVAAEFQRLGNAQAPQKGIFKINMTSEPHTLDPTASSDAYASQVQSYVIESLLTKNTESYDWQPGLATSWEISEDKKVFEFEIRQGVKWHDGKPLGVEDIKFSFDHIFSEEFKAKQLIPYFENIEKAEIIGKNKIRFTAKNRYFKNFDVVAGISVIPKHIYSIPRKEQKQNLNQILVGTGPYQLKSYDKGKRIVLEKNKKWWGNEIKSLKGMNNFSSIQFRFVSEENVQLEMLKKGKIDFLGMRPETFVKKTNGKIWEESIVKVKTQNKAAKGYSFIGLNLTKPLFQERKLRLALAHLFNRDYMIKRFEYNMAVKATGPIYRQSDYANEEVAAIEYNPKKALSILRGLGWKDTDGDLVLDKEINGIKTPLRFTIIEPSSDMMKYLTKYKEDARKMGVRIDLKRVEWTSFIKLLDEKKFDAVRLAWNGGSVDWDPKQIWHSSSAAKGGSNFISYKNLKVDKLIDEAREIYDESKRKKLLREVYEMIAKDIPYIFFFNTKYTLYGHRKRISKPTDSFQYGIGMDYWWLSE